MRCIKYLKMCLEHGTDFIHVDDDNKVSPKSLFSEERDSLPSALVSSPLKVDPAESQWLLEIPCIVLH